MQRFGFGIVLSIFTMSALLSYGEAAVGNAGVAVKVRVRSSAGKAIVRPYAALVPGWRPSSRPMAEEVGDKDLVILRAQPGEYRLIAGAPGHAVTVRQPVLVTEGMSPDIEIELPVLREVGGTVRDETGTPLGGVRIRTVHAAIPAGVGLFSEKALSALGADWSAMTDQRGVWSLAVPQGPVPLQFQVGGKGEHWSIVPDAQPVVDVTLLQGSVLQVNLDRIDPAMIVTLAREDETSTGGASGEQQNRARAQWATDQVLTWSSLTPGAYSIYARYSEPEYFMRVAEKLGAVALKAGDHQRVDVALPQKRARAAVTSALYLSRVPEKELDGEIQAFGSTPAGASRQIDHFVEETIGGSVVHLRANDVQEPFTVIASDRVFGSPLRAPDASPSIDVPPLAVVHPRADAYAFLRFEAEGMPMPAGGVAVLRECAEDSLMIMPVHVRKDGLARLTAAAGCRTLALALEPYEPLLLERRLRPGDQDLGAFTLRAAGEIAAHVVKGVGGGPVGGATVIVTASGESGSDATIIVQEAVSDETGWARLTGLPPQRDLSIVAQTIEGDRSEPLTARVDPAMRTVVDPLAIVEPATLIVDLKIDPALLSRFPDARIVTVMTEPADRSEESERRQQNTPKPAAPIRFERLRPGQWMVTGVVSVAGTYSPVEVGSVSLEPGRTELLAKPILPNVFEGIVTSGGKGVAAKVMIEDRGRMLYFKSGENGLFHAVLLDRRAYKVSVSRMSAQGNIIPVGNVDFTDPSRRVEISIPGGGSVKVRVRRDREPAVGAFVWMSRRDSEGVVDRATRRANATDSAGTATFDDVAPGRWSFTVTDDASRRSAEKSMEIEDGASASVDLDLVRAASVEGKIRDTGGRPLHPARVDCVFIGAAGVPDRAGANTRADGTFSIDLTPPGPENALCSVVGPGNNAEAFRAGRGRFVEIALPLATGAVQISASVLPSSPDSLWLIANDGRAISLDALARQTALPGQAFSVSLASGHWKIVRAGSLGERLLLAYLFTVQGNGCGARGPEAFG